MVIRPEIARFVDGNSGNWRRVVDYTSKNATSINDVLYDLELVKKAFHTPDLLSASEVEEIEMLYMQIREAYPELGLT